jgi:hypothetical protein
VLSQDVIVKQLRSRPASAQPVKVATWRATGAEFSAVLGVRGAGNGRCHGTILCTTRQISPANMRDLQPTCRHTISGYPLRRIGHPVRFAIYYV